MSLTFLCAEHIDLSGRTFITKVAELVALKRMPSGVASVSCTFEPLTSTDEDEYNNADDFSFEEDSD